MFRRHRDTRGHRSEAPLPLARRETSTAMSFATAATPPARAAAPARRVGGRRAVASAHGTSAARPSGHGTRAPVPRRARGDAAVAAVAAGSPPPARVARRPDASVEEKFWEWEGHRIRYTVAGDAGPAMVLVHGFGGNADHWRKNTPVLGKHGRVFAIDLLGYGYSSKPDPMVREQNAIYNFENWSSQLRAFVKDVVGEPAFLMCNSVGGVAGLQAAVDDKALVRGVVLLNISLRGLHVTKQPPFAKPFIKALQTTLRTTDVGKAFFGNVARAETVRNVLREAYGDPETVTDELVECILKPGLQEGAAEVFLDFISYSGGPLPEDLLPRVADETPVRILWGRDDPWEVVREGRKYGEYACVDRFIELPGVGHCPMDEAPDLVNPLLLEFVNDYRGVTRGAE